MWTFARGAIVAALLGTPAGISSAQVPSFPASTEMVVLSATAVDTRGKPITDLRRDELRVFEENRPQDIVHFVAGALVPARVLILVDASGSMSGELKVTSARMAATQVVAALGEEDQVSLVSFASHTTNLVDWTKDKARALEGFDRLKPFGATALHDALDLSASALADGGEGRRAIVVVTDGIDTASRVTPDRVIEKSRALDVPIYAVTVTSRLDDPRSKTYVGAQGSASSAHGQDALAQYAALSGGGAFVVSDFAGLKGAADRIALEVRHQYRLGYAAPDGPGGFRRVAILASRKGVLVRTRSGYVAGP